MIEVKKLSKHYNDGAIKAVDNISFKINKGEIVGFLGPNGAGKSTTLKLLTGYIKPTKGEIKIADIDIVKDGLNARKKIGYLPESTALYQNMKVIEFLNFIIESREIPKDKVKERLDYVIHKLELNSRAYQTISSLSKGFKQRVGLAQAIIHNPDFIILDEPTSGLDPNQVIEIRNLIKEISREKTVIFSSHILQEVEALCDKIIIINRGKIISMGSKEELHKDNLIINLTLKGDSKLIMDSLKNLKDIKLNLLNTFNNLVRVNIETLEDKREEIFNCAKNNNFIILEMFKENESLESIFKKLTLEE